MTVTEPLAQLEQFETNLRKCIAQMNRYRDESERLRQVAESVQGELAEIQFRDSHFDERKGHIVRKLESLLGRIDSLHIETISND